MSEHPISQSSQQTQDTNIIKQMQCTSSGNQTQYTDPGKQIQDSTSGKKMQYTDSGNNTQDKNSGKKTIYNTELDVLRLTLTDIHGQQRTCKHYVKDFVRVAEEPSEVFCGTILHGPRSEDVDLKCITDNHCGNVSVVPRLETFKRLAWIEDLRVGEILCETALLRPSRSGPAGVAAPECTPECTRRIARHLLDRLRSDFDCEILAAFEIEFVELDDPYGQACAVSSASAYREHRLARLCRRFNGEGITVDSFSREYAAGQYELNQTASRGIESADQAVRIKQAIKETFPPGRVTFMPKHKYDECCNGLHFNFSLWKNGRDLFTDHADADGMSEVARAWMSGLIRHASAVSTLCNPTVNCYRRLHNAWTPGAIYWHVDDRHACFRLRNTSGGTFVESRLPSGAANPYLVMAAHLAAGMDGLRRHLPLVGKRENRSDLRLPTTLAEGLHCLREDDVITKAMGQPFVDAFCDIKTKVELTKLKHIDVKRKATCDGDLEDENQMYLMYI